MVCSLRVERSKFSSQSTGSVEKSKFGRKTEKFYGKSQKVGFSGTWGTCFFQLCSHSTEILNSNRVVAHYSCQMTVNTWKFTVKHWSDCQIPPYSTTQNKQEQN